MEHYFETIQGWFYYPNLYTEMVSRFDNAVFLEVGCWKGKSTAYMAVEIMNAKKNIELFCVDTWKGSGEHKSNESVQNNTLYKEFLYNILPVKDIIKGFKTTSMRASKMFPDGFFDFVFIDASHKYQDVKNDLFAWYPKVKNGGVFAGHDYQPFWDGVQRAVDEFTKEKELNIRVQEDCWIIEKRDT